MEKREFNHPGQEPRERPSNAPLPSETVQNAHSAGDGALERSDSQLEEPAARPEDSRTGEPDDTTRY